MDLRFAEELGEPWARLAGFEVSGGYEIRHGCSEPTAPLAEAISGGLGWVDGSLLALSVHGVMESPEILAALFGKPPSRSLDEAIDDLADAVMGSLDGAAIESLVTR